MLSEISYGLHRLPLALRRASEGTSDLSASRASSIFRVASETMQSSLGLTASEAWLSALKVYDGSRELTERDLNTLKSFGDSLGNGGLSEQIKHINLALDSLKREIDTADEDSRRMGKVYRSVWMAAGACVVLLLI
jgi:stage III sporulation protein AB